MFVVLTNSDSFPAFGDTTVILTGREPVVPCGGGDDNDDPAGTFKLLLIGLGTVIVATPHFATNFLGLPN